MASENDQLPDNVTEVGYVRVSIVMGPNGIGTAFKIEGVSPEAAIGHLIVVTDRLREDRSLSWAGDDFEIESIQCPNCGAEFGCGDDDCDG